MAWDDLTAGTNKIVRDSFGKTSVIYTPKMGSPYQITGIFGESFVEVGGGAGDVPTQALKPVLSVVLSDLTAIPAKGDKVTIDTVYDITESQPDGQGMALLILKKA